MMNEKTWVNAIVDRIQAGLDRYETNLVVSEGRKLPYASEILSYTEQRPKKRHSIAYETDLLITEQLTEQEWKPRLIIEAKINTVSTHDAITYSQKAFTHKMVHPYLRYGILIGNRKHYPLPGRLFRHGAYFDFMLSWQAFEPAEAEFTDLLRLIRAEITASRHLEEIIFNSRSRNRERYTVLHRPLVLK